MAIQLSNDPLESIALALGRKRAKRGKEPTYESTLLGNVPVLTIPNHGARTVSPGVAKNVLGQLDQDVFWLEQKINEQNKKEVIHEDRYTH